MNQTTDTREWRRTSPFAVLFFFGRLLRGLIKNAAQAIVPLAAVIFTFDGSLFDRIGLAAGGALAVAIVVSVLRYLFFRFQISDSSVLIREGIFQKKQLDIKFHRIQGINTEQNFVAKRFGLVNIKFDTAGSSTDEGILPAVTEDFAKRLQAKIDGIASRPEADVERVESLLQLDFCDMVRIGLSDGRALLILAVLGPLIEQGGDRVERVIYSAAASGFDRLQSFGFVGGLIIALSILAVVYCLVAIGSIIAAYLRYYNFELTLEKECLRTVGGLFTRHQASMKLAKIQRIRLRQNIMLRLFRRYRLVVQQTSSSGKKSESNSIVVPLLDESFGNELAHKLFAPEATTIGLRPADSRFMRVNRRYVRSRSLMIGVLPLIPAATPLIMAFGPLAAVALLWPLFAYLAIRRYWRRLGFYVTDSAFVRRRGLFGFGVDAFLHRKVQRVSVSQSLMQRRRGLASLHIFLASGRVSIPYLSCDDAATLRDFIVYSVESTDLAWH